MLPARLDSGLLRLLAVVTAIAVGALVFNPGLPLVFIPALIIALIAAVISYRRNQGDTWWKIPAVAFVGASILTLTGVIYLLLQK